MTISNTLKRVSARSLILGTLWAMLLLSLASSLSIRAGHADTAIAATAAESMAGP